MAKECEAGEDYREKVVPDIQLPLHKLTEAGIAMIVTDPNKPTVYQEVEGMGNTKLTLIKNRFFKDGSTTELKVKTKSERIEDSLKFTTNRNMRSTMEVTKLEVTK